MECSTGLCHLTDRLRGRRQAVSTTGAGRRYPPPGCKTQVYPHTRFPSFSRPGKPHSHVAKSNCGRCRDLRLENERFSLKIVPHSLFWNLNSEALTRRTPKNIEKSANRPSILYNKPQEPLKHYGAPTLAATLQPSQKTRKHRKTVYYLRRRLPDNFLSLIVALSFPAGRQQS